MGEIHDGWDLLALLGLGALIAVLIWAVVRG